MRRQGATQTWGEGEQAVYNRCSDQPIIRASPVRQPLYFVRSEKRAVVILRPDDWEEWLTTSTIEAARAMLQLYSAEEMEAAPK
ncbi:hypothetical protein NL30_10830 [Burkholderia contaminans]|nr:hypothetical protein NL30_10830 [Burkholderia contaminans]